MALRRIVGLKNKNEWVKIVSEVDMHKSVNLQNNTLGFLDDGINESWTKRCLMFQVLFFFMISCKILFKNPFNLFSYFFYKDFECPKFIKSIKR